MGLGFGLGDRIRFTPRVWAWVWARVRVRVSSPARSLGSRGPASRALRTSRTHSPPARGRVRGRVGVGAGVGVAVGVRVRARVGIRVGVRDGVGVRVRVGDRARVGVRGMPARGACVAARAAACACRRWLEIARQIARSSRRGRASCTRRPRPPPPRCR